MCGKEDGPVEKLSKEKKIQMLIESTSIEEDPKWKKILDINAVISFGVAVFLHAFWA